MKYDDASWHYGGDFPKGLPPEAGATHMGMFVAWAHLSGLAGEVHEDDVPADLGELRKEGLTPGAYFIRACDEKFTDDDLNDEGNAFAAAYYEGENNQYLQDYQQIVVKRLPSAYHVPDTWDTFETLSPVLSSRLAEWRRGQPFGPTPEPRRKPWWRFW
jgi:hypothetical protein